MRRINFILVMALAACQPAPPPAPVEQPMSSGAAPMQDMERMIEPLAMDMLKMDGIAAARLAKTLLDRRVVADRPGLRADITAMEAAIKEADAAAKRDDFDVYRVEMGKARRLIGRVGTVHGALVNRKDTK